MQLNYFSIQNVFSTNFFGIAGVIRIKKDRLILKRAQDLRLDFSVYFNY
jgi:hypothetical protein